MRYSASGLSKVGCRASNCRIIQMVILYRMYFAPSDRPSFRSLPNRCGSVAHSPRLSVLVSAYRKRSFSVSSQLSFRRRTELFQTKLKPSSSSSLAQTLSNEKRSSPYASNTIPSKPKQPSAIDSGRVDGGRCIHAYPGLCRTTPDNLPSRSADFLEPTAPIHTSGLWILPWIAEEYPQPP